MSIPGSLRPQNTPPQEADTIGALARLAITARRDEFMGAFRTTKEERQPQDSPCQETSWLPSPNQKDYSQELPTRQVGRSLK